jgi:hypothetical protein
MHFTLRHGAYLALFLLLVTAISLGCMSTPAYPPPDGSASVWIEYHRSGGTEAVDDHLVIYENLSTDVTRRDIASGNVTRHFQLNKTEGTDLNNLFAQAHFLQLKEFYPPPYEGTSYYLYVISYRGHQIQTEDTGVPSELVPILDALNGILETGCSGDVCPVP